MTRKYRKYRVNDRFKFTQFHPRARVPGDITVSAVQVDETRTATCANSLLQGANLHDPLSNMSNRGKLSRLPSHLRDD